ncbi:Glycosyl transferase, group 2 [Chitinispirillum alkaliphilum]|nr:Glycosyl transferase, group 2 [Chitinispirillum alkaliphilum]
MPNKNKNMTADKVLVGIVGYKSEDHIFACIESVLAQTYKNIEIIYYDNYGLDNALDIVQTNFPQVKCVKSDSNLGYGKAHNWIINNYEFGFYMPLNPDLILSEDFISNCYGEIQGDPTIGAINGILYHLKDGKKTSVVYSCGHIMQRDRRIDNLHYGIDVSGKDITSRFVFGPNGACPLLKKEMIRDVEVNKSFFDPAFFMYGDDFDIGWRMSKAGWKTLFSPHCKAWHIIGGSEPFKNRKIRVDYIANRLILILKNERFFLFLRDLPLILIIELFFLLVLSLKRPAFIIDYISGIKKFLFHIPYAIRLRKQIRTRTSLRDEINFYEKNYLSRFVTLVQRQIIKGRNLSHVK